MEDYLNFLQMLSVSNTPFISFVEDECYYIAYMSAPIGDSGKKVIVFIFDEEKNYLSSYIDDSDSLANFARDVYQN